MNSTLTTALYCCFRECLRPRSTASWHLSAASITFEAARTRNLRSLLKSQIPIRAWAQWDDVVPGFVEIDLVGHEGGNSVGDHCYTLAVTDIATGPAENRSVPNKARKWVIAALDEISKILLFPLLGVD